MKDMARYNERHKPGASRQRFIADITNEQPYKLRGENRQKAIELGKKTEYNRLALMMVSVLHLSHWRLAAKYAKAYSERMSTVNPEFE